QRAFQKATGNAFVADLGDGADKRGDRSVVIDEVGGTDQTVVADACFVREVMKHQNTPTETITANLKAAAIGGEWIVAREPGAGIVRCGRVCRMLAVVKDHFKHPTRL